MLVLSPVLTRGSNTRSGGAVGVLSSFVLRRRAGNLSSVEPPTERRQSESYFTKTQQIKQIYKCRHKEVCFLYGAVGPFRALYTSPPGRPVHSDTNSASPASILVMLQLHAKTISLTFPPPSTGRYSFKQLSQLGHQWRERKCPNFETVAKGNTNPGSLDCESGILLLSYVLHEGYITCKINHYCKSNYLSIIEFVYLPGLIHFNINASWLYSSNKQFACC